MPPKSWIVLNCQSQGIERLSIVDRESRQVICRLENTVSGRPLGDDDFENAQLIANAPKMATDFARLEEEADDLSRRVLEAQRTLDRIRNIVTSAAIHGHSIAPDEIAKELQAFATRP